MLGVGALIFDAGRVLLVERGHEPLMGWWSLPGGAVETGERLREAIQREVMEETNLVVEPLEVVEIFERLMKDAGHRTEYHYVLIDYLCRITGGDLRAGAGQHGKAQHHGGERGQINRRHVAIGI